eukprot:1107146-Amphidinium_carterae.1
MTPFGYAWSLHQPHDNPLNSIWLCIVLNVGWKGRHFFQLVFTDTSYIRAQRHWNGAKYMLLEHFSVSNGNDRPPLWTTGGARDNKRPSHRGKKQPGTTTEIGRGLCLAHPLSWDRPQTPKFQKRLTKGVKK